MTASERNRQSRRAFRRWREKQKRAHLRPKGQRRPLRWIPAGMLGSWVPTVGWVPILIRTPVYKTTPTAPGWAHAAGYSFARWKR